MLPNDLRHSTRKSLFPILAIALAMALGCPSNGSGGDDDDDYFYAGPVKIYLSNMGSESLFISYYEATFEAVDSEGFHTVSHPPENQAPCDDCWCGYREVIAHALEIPPGITANTQFWVGKLYDPDPTTCDCGSGTNTCFEPVYLVPGDYTFIFRYDLSLPNGFEWYEDNTNLDGGIVWSVPDGDEGFVYMGNTEVQYDLTFAEQDEFVFEVTP